TTRLEEETVALTGQDILNSITKAPLSQKVVGLGLIVGLLTAGNWYLLVDPVQQQITRQQAALRQLEDELIQKQSIANNLAQFKREKEILERRLQQALTELPNEANIDELIRSLAEVGNKSGLVINDIAPQAEQKQSFYAAIPVVMAVTGNYHEVGVFLDAISKLARNATRARTCSVTRRTPACASRVASRPPCSAGRWTSYGSRLR